MENTMTNRGNSLEVLSGENRILLIFLRHFGCTFCRETMTNLSGVLGELKTMGVKPVLVHMVSGNLADNILELYKLNGVEHISDPQKALYHRFGFKQARWRHLLHPHVVWRSAIAGLVNGHFSGKPVGDPYQMPGLVLYHHHSILNKFEYRRVCDRPDFVKFVKQS